jgi:PST family polysaccharide transporter
VGAQLIGMVILARLLSPADFGIVAMAAVVIGFANIFRDFGTVPAVIQRRELDAPLLNSVFLLNGLIGSALALLLAAAAPLIALAMREPELSPVLRSLAIVFPIVSAGLVQQGLLEREVRFRPVALIEFAAAVAGLAAAVLGALAGWGVYSLVLQMIVSATVTTAGLWAVSAWRPGRQMSLSQLRDLVKFSGNVVGFSTINYFARNMDSILIGRFLGATDLGFYSVAYKLMMWPLQNISWVAGRALFPNLSRLQDDKEQLSRSYVRGSAAVFTVTAPLTLGLFVLREPFVLALLGESWRTVADLLFWLAPVSLVQSVGTTVGWLYLSTGRADLMFKFALLYSAASVSAFLIGLQWGVLGVAAAYCVSSLLLFWPSLAVPFRLVGLGVGRFLRRLAAPFLAACLMAIILATVYEHSGRLSAAPWARLAELVCLGAAMYLSIMVVVHRRALKEAADTLLAR